MNSSDVSIIISCHNLETYLGEAIESIRSQTVAPREVIVVHDGCEKPATYAGTTTVVREKNRGVARTRHEGFLLSEGQQILFMDADDMLTETFLNEMLHTLSVGADIAYPDSLLWSRWGDSKFQNGIHNAPNKITLKQMLFMNQVVVTSLMKRKVYENTVYDTEKQLIGFDPQYRIYEDWEFWIRALVCGYKFKKANTYLKYRQRTQSRNHQSDDLKKDTCKAIQMKYVAHLAKKS